MGSSRLLIACSVLLTACEPAAAVAPPAAAPSSPTAVAERGEAAPTERECVAITRANWQAEWSDYVEKETKTYGKYFSPAPGAHRWVRDTDVTPGRPEIGLNIGGSVGITPPSIFDDATLTVKPHEIVDRQVPGDAIASMCLTGAHARVYWTKAHKMVRSDRGQTVESTFSTVFIEGSSPGDARLTLRLPDDTTKTITLVVRAL